MAASYGDNYDQNDYNRPRRSDPHSVAYLRSLPLDEASAELGVSRNTTRTHLRAVFAKTGVSRQTGLVRLILNSVAPLAGDMP